MLWRMVWLMMGMQACLMGAAIGADSTDPERLFENPVPEQIASGFSFTEGPVWNAQGYLLFSDIPNARIHRWTPDGQSSVFRESSGNSNGLTFDRQGRLIACEHGNRRVSRTEADGTVITLADRYQGKRLNSPNDVAVRSDGSIYFTDPPYGLKKGDVKELPFNGLYRLSPQGELTLLADDFDRPNGVAFSPDEKILYVSDTTRRHLRALDVKDDGTLANSRVLAQIPAEMRPSPDGLKVDTAGNIYLTAGPAGLWVFRPDGSLLARIATPEGVENCAFGEPDQRSLFLTAPKAVYRLRTRIPGVKTH